MPDTAARTRGRAPVQQAGQQRLLLSVLPHCHGALSGETAPRRGWFCGVMFSSGGKFHKKLADTAGERAADAEAPQPWAPGPAALVGRQAAGRAREPATLMEMLLLPPRL